MRRFSTKQGFSIAADTVKDHLIRVRQQTVWKFRNLQHQKLAIFMDIENEQQVDSIQLSGKPLADKIQLLELLESSSKNTLNSFLQSKAPEDASHVGPRMAGFLMQCTAGSIRLKLAELLAVHRVKELDLDNRIDLVRGVQRVVQTKPRDVGRLRNFGMNVILNTHGNELTTLKEGIDVRTKEEGRLDEEDPYAHIGDLGQLVFQHPSLGHRAEMLQHIAVQALNSDFQRVRIVSDIDDTIYAGWLDKRYPAGILYPGVLNLHKLLSKNTSAGSARNSATFLTARPRGWFSIVKNLTSKQLKDAGMTAPTVLPGTFRSLTSNRNIGRQKLEQIVRYLALFPEYNVAFFGDTSQGDAIVAEYLLDRYPHRVVGAFLHDVNPESDVTGDDGLKSKYQSKGVVLFNSFVGAGIAAHKAKLITLEELTQHINICREELESINFNSLDGDAVKQARINEMKLDIDSLR